MIRTGREYLDSIRDGREVYIDGERVADVTRHPMMKPLIDIRARIYDMQHEAAHARHPGLRARRASGTRSANKLPRTQADWWDKRRATDTVLEEIGGSRHPRRGRDRRRDVVAVRRPGRAQRGRPAVLGQHPPAHRGVLAADPFHVSANTDPKGDRSKPPQEQDPDMLLHVVRETDAGIVVRGAKYETAAPYANQAFTKPTIANWGDGHVGLRRRVHLRARLAQLKFICRTGFAGRASAADYPLANRFDEVDALVIFDDVLIPWENVLFYRHTRAATFIRATLHRYSAFAFVQRNLKLADMMIGAALFNARQTASTNSRRCRRSSRSSPCTARASTRI